MTLSRIFNLLEKLPNDLDFDNAKVWGYLGKAPTPGAYFSQEPTISLGQPISSVNCIESG